MKPLDVTAGHFSPCLGRLRGVERPVSRSWTRVRRVRACALNEIAVELGSSWHTINVVRFHHPVVGELTLAYEGLEMAAEPGLTLTIYTAEPASPSDERLRLLGSWAASQETEPTRRLNR